MTTFSEVYDLALRLIDDPTLIHWPEEDLENELYGWMMQSIYLLPKLKKELSSRDDDERVFASDLSDVAKMALALNMKRQWLGPQIASVTLTLQRSSKKESSSQASHLKALQALDESINVELKKLLRDGTYADNAYFEE